MHNVVLPQDFQPCNQLAKYFNSLLLFKFSLLFKQVVKSASSTILINKIAIIFSLQQFIEFYDMWTWLKHLVDGKFIVDALFDLLVVREGLVIDDFDSEDSAVIEMPGLENLTVGSLPQHISQFVSAHDSPHLHLPHSRSVFHLEQYFDYYNSLQ